MCFYFLEDPEDFCNKKAVCCAALEQRTKAQHILGGNAPCMSSIQAHTRFLTIVCFQYDEDKIAFTGRLATATPCYCDK